MNILVKNIITFILLTISYFCDIVITDQAGFATTVLLFIIPALQESVDECLQTQNMEKYYISYVVIMAISVIIGIYIAKHNGK